MRPYGPFILTCVLVIMTVAVASWRSERAHLDGMAAVTKPMTATVVAIIPVQEEYRDYNRTLRYRTSYRIDAEVDGQVWRFRPDADLQDAVPVGETFDLWKVDEQWYSPVHMPSIPRDAVIGGGLLSTVSLSWWLVARRRVRRRGDDGFVATRQEETGSSEA